MTRTLQVDHSKMVDQRTRLGWSQIKLAKEAHVVPRTIERAEAGESLYLETARRIAEALKLHLEDLIADRRKAGPSKEPDHCRIKIDEDFDRYTDEHQRNFLRELHQRASLVGEVRVIARRAGCVELTLTMSLDDQARVSRAFADGVLSDLKVVDLESVASDAEEAGPGTPRDHKALFAAIGFAALHLVSTSAWISWNSVLSRVDYWWQFQRWQVFWGAITVIAAGLIWKFIKNRFWQAAGKYLFILALLGTAIVGFAMPEFQKSRVARQVDDLMAPTRWVTYEPPQWNPHDTLSMPGEAQIEKELSLLKDVGFDGIVTFTAAGNLGEVPRIAKSVGFRSVVLGISSAETDKRPVEQLKHAKEVVEYVDGYCILHNPSNAMDIGTLAKWMAELRRETGRPVTTTFPLVNYLGERGRPIREIGDWFMPDVDLSWSRKYLSPNDAYDELTVVMRNVEDLPHDRPVLLKMVGYPSGPPESGYSEKGQAEFVYLVNDLRLPVGSSICWFSAFDLPWKGSRPDHEFKPQEEFVGLWRADMSAKPAIEAVQLGPTSLRRK